MSGPGPMALRRRDDGAFDFEFHRRRALLRRMWQDLLVRASTPVRRGIHRALAVGAPLSARRREAAARPFSGQ
ncbi:hypothetical protein GCM10010964_27090 [Caldovatus sediminis]|uniref:Uncharacterized protein n=1 Tax=Caldovatus sediminis TaxID=2041189 RepID=A0A8J2ZCN2_9PROT|nr:hypothetical protein GCM10010964_27090 [Caldovatus sediminis]